MIEVQSVTKRFKSLTAVDQLSFSVQPGELFAFLGTNGAGKTTTISCMTTLLKPDEGEILIDGLRIGKDDHRIRDRIGIVFQTSLLDPQLTVRENLLLRTKIYQVPNTRIAELIRLVDLGSFIDRRYGVLSGGQKRRADIARALLHQPKVLFLDEPTTGLDPQSREQVWKAIHELRENLGLTVLLTTHYMQETEDADQVLVIDQGKALASGTPLELRARYSSPTLTVAPATTETADKNIRAILQEHAPLSEVYEMGGTLKIQIPDSIVTRRILEAAGSDIQDFQFIHGTMDDVFINLSKNKGEM